MRRWRWIGDMSLEAVERYKFFLWLRYDLQWRKYL